MRVNKTYSLDYETIKRLEHLSQVEGKARSRLLEELIINGCRDREIEDGYEAINECGGNGEYEQGESVNSET